MSSVRSRQLHVLFPLLVSAACGGSTENAQTPSGSSGGSSGGSSSGGSSSGGSSSGGSSSSGSTAGFTLPLTCTTQGNANWSAATPAASIDGFEIRRMMNQTYAAVATPKPLCTKATNAPACSQATAAVTGNGWDPYGGADLGPRPAEYELAVTTAVDKVTVLRTVDELTPALAPIETQDEALILAQLRSGWRPVCVEPQKTVLAARASGDGFELLVQKGGQCGAALIEAVVRVSKDGTVTVVSQTELKPGGPNPCGRRPEGLEPLANEGPSGVAGLLARMAWLEAASVPAFAALANDLSRHGAPRDLVERALAARGDEITHARVTREAARRHGADVERPRIPRAAPRTLLELALENAVEGCVREAFGALVATHQAERATDPALAAMFATIAKDETEHAALSFDLAEWMTPRLSDAERERVAEARAQAYAELDAELAKEPSHDETTLAGMPTRDTARRLLEALRRVDATGVDPSAASFGRTAVGGSAGTYAG